jgi:tRNA A-37 threonylcarbamoyl transferase component Bud32/tetratricopeptide (TPR) repeat protein
LCEALADFLTRHDAGKPIDRDMWIAGQPEHGEALRAFFETADRLERLFRKPKPGEGSAPKQTPPARPRDTVDLNAETVVSPPPREKPTKDITVDVSASEVTQGSGAFRVLRDPEPAASKPPAPKTDTPAPRFFGDYEILQEIAEGGMGVVYKARQRKLNRIVALKMILAGRLANALEVERFYAEAEAAANLRHPNIVDVYEVGEIGGRHFFSMEFINGQSLSDLVRRQPLEPQRAAQLVKKIAETIQFAHEQGVIHRDLKPSNVLLDERGEPMITDFGLAKRTKGNGSQATLTGQVIGTPSYMPPEQARGAEVGTEGDVYSMGAILYELLTAAPPFSAAHPLDTIKQVLEVEPVPPRVRNPSLPRDLETICLKCLQKEPARRYATAGELADELGRYLEGKPIRARPVSVLEKIWRWRRRNPSLALCCVACLGSLLLAAGVLVGAYVRVSLALADARQSFQHTRTAIDELFNIVSESTLLNEPGAQGLRKELLLKARDLYHEVLAQRGHDPAIRDELALSYFRLGRIMQEIDTPQEALGALTTAREMQTALAGENAQDQQVRDALGDTLTALGKSYDKLRQYDQAQAAYLEAVQIREQLAATDDNAESRRKLLNAYMNLAVIQKMRGDLADNDADAAAFYRAAHEQYLNEQRERQKQLEPSPDAEDLRLDLAKGFYNLANVAFEMRHYPEAAKYAQQAVAEFSRLVADAPENLEYQYLHALAVRRCGDVEREPAVAQTYYEQAIRSLRGLAETNPQVHKYAAALASVYMNQGLVDADTKQDAAAVASFEQAIGVLRRLVQETKQPSYRRDLGNALTALGGLQIETGALEDARQNLVEAQQLLKELVDAYPAAPDFADQLALAQATMADLDDAAAKQSALLLKTK